MAAEHPPLAKRPRAAARRWGRALGRGAALLGLVLAGNGCMIYYEEEGRGIHVPEPEAASVPVFADTPFAITFKWDGLNYAFNNLWLVVDDGATSGGAFEIRGEYQCWNGAARKVETGLLGRHVHEREDRPGGRFSAWIFLESEYLRSSKTPITCSGTIHPVSGSWAAARIVVTQRQRPSDFFAF